MRIVLIVLSVVSLTSCISGSYRSLTGDFELREYKEKVLSNGMKVLLIEDKTLPYISAAMLLRVGSVDDPVAKPGLTQFVAELLDKGTQKRSATDVANKFGQIGASFSASVSDDFTVISSGTLSHYQDNLFELLGEVLSLQRFSASEVRRVRKQMQSYIKKSSDDPGSFASQMFSTYLYGSHPYGKSSVGTSSSLRSIKRKDIIRHYMKYFRPNNATLAVVGNFNENVISVLEKSFGQWQKRDVPKTIEMKVADVDGVNIRLIDAPGLVQAQLRIGHAGISRMDPDYLKLRVANTVLGRGFVSRLMDRIRDELGLTYSISSQFDSRKQRGPFVISTFTRNEKVGTAITEVLKLLKEFKEKGISDAELEATKRYLLGVFPQAIDTPEKLAYNLLVLKYYGISDSYLENYAKVISSFERDEINEAISKHIHPQKLKILVYGKKREIIEQVRKVGVVEIRKASEFQ